MSYDKFGGSTFPCTPSKVNINIVLDSLKVYLAYGGFWCLHSYVVYQNRFAKIR